MNRKIRIDDTELKTTIVIPNYNGIEYLKACLKSLYECENRDFAIIVVDNGSSDGSAAYIRDTYPEVKLIALEENTGFAPAVNRGIEASDTEYVLLLNNDIEVSTDFVRCMEESLDSHPKAFSVSARMLSMHNKELLDGTGDYYCALGWAFACGKGKRAQDRYLKERKLTSACAGAAIYRREELVKMGAFDELHFAYLEDVDVGLRARIEGFDNIYEPKAVCYHAGSGFSGSRHNEFKVTLSSRNSVYIIYKNMPLLQFIINLPFLLIGFIVKALFFAMKGLGLTYVKGLGEGLKLSFGKEGRKHKVRFKWGNLGHYVRLQLELWRNLVFFVIL